MKNLSNIPTDSLNEQLAAVSKDIQVIKRTLATTSLLDSVRIQILSGLLQANTDVLNHIKAELERRNILRS